MVRCRFAISMTVIIILLTLASATSAAPPIHWEDEFYAQRLVTTCGFPILAEAQLHYWGTVHFDSDGDVSMELEHTNHRLTYTNIATGEPVSGSQTRTHKYGELIFNPDGTMTYDALVHGVEIRLVQPGSGVITLTSGQLLLHLLFSEEGELEEKTLTFLNGHDELLFPALCEALSP